MNATRHDAGFTLIELMIGITILAIALMLGIPSFAEWIQNSQIRTAGESIASGLQSARGEAIRRNTPVQFTLTGAGGTGENGWQIVERNSNTILQSQPANDGSRNVTLATTPADAKTLTFNGLGRVASNNADGTSVLTRIDIDNPKLDAATSRDLRIMIESGGSIRMCDPNMSISGDPRAC